MLPRFQIVQGAQGPLSRLLGLSVEPLLAHQRRPLVVQPVLLHETPVFVLLEAQLGLGRLARVRLLLRLLEKVLPVTHERTGKKKTSVGQQVITWAKLGFNCGSIFNFILAS